mmetsp:Transcript_24595/g.27989  ORF Transcript_24595/g.27989 Transcript_24595/m.27989 type:complete len:124 (-) Transcript_24595:27-398(-)
MDFFGKENLLGILVFGSCSYCPLKLVVILWVFNRQARLYDDRNIYKKFHERPYNQEASVSGTNKPVSKRDKGPKNFRTEHLLSRGEASLFWLNVCSTRLCSVLSYLFCFPVHNFANYSIVYST